jgi:hypothetical protein
MTIGITTIYIRLPSPTGMYAIAAIMIAVVGGVDISSMSAITYQHRIISLLLQPRGCQVCKWPDSMRGTETSRVRGYHGVNGRRPVACCSGFWFPLWYDQPKVISSNWLGDLVSWLPIGLILFYSSEPPMLIASNVCTDFLSFVRRRQNADVGYTSNSSNPTWSIVSMSVYMLGFGLDYLTWISRQYYVGIAQIICSKEKEKGHKVNKLYPIHM